MSPGRGVATDLSDDRILQKDADAAALRADAEPGRTRVSDRSPLTRKIIAVNLIALNVLVAGILWLNSARDTLAIQKANALQSEVELIADILEVRGSASGTGLRRGGDLSRTLAGIDLRAGTRLLVFDAEHRLLGEAEGRIAPLIAPSPGQDGASLISDAIKSGRSALSAAFAKLGSDREAAGEDPIRDLLVSGDPATTRVEAVARGGGRSLYHAVSPVVLGGQVAGSVALVSSPEGIDDAVAAQQERVLRMFVVATLVSIGLSLVLASAIANPISALATAAERGRERHSYGMARGRIRIPDLTARSDEIGRLSGALRGLVGALYDRIDSNEQFAADVAHEIKNPLASMRSAVGSLGVVRKEDQRRQLLDVIEHDVRRLDRLVSDISNASRLDSELVKEEEQAFDLLDMLGKLTAFLREDARGQGIEFITDLPQDPIYIRGLEPRLAQVFVNLIVNALSFCEDGDAIRVWARRRENRVLVVVEDTGPGIPEEALTKIFKRFYTSRPSRDFGNNSGLGLSISKQIVEAHGGVIWAENIRPTEADITSEPLGARFAVGLPI